MIELNTTLLIQLKADFEKYMTKFYAVNQRFHLEDFAVFSATILNYHINNAVLQKDSKEDAAYYLTTLYNKGIGNRISEEHLVLIASTIANDYTVDFSVIQTLFDA